MSALDLHPGRISPPHWYKKGDAAGLVVLDAEKVRQCLALLSTLGSDPTLDQHHASVIEVAEELLAMAE